MGSSRQFRLSSVLVRGAVVFLAIGLGACSSSDGERARAPTPRATVNIADYITYSQHFLALQKAGLNGDYAGFAQHLKPADPQSVIQRLNVSFNGRPFDVYTRKTSTSDTTHRRVIELRGMRGRLYLLVRLDRVSGGWKVSDYTIGRDGNAILARL